MRRVLLWMALAMVIVTAGAACAGYFVLRSLRQQRAPIVYSPDTHPTPRWQGSPALAQDDELEASPKLPQVKRRVPVFEVRLLDGCSSQDLDTVETRIGSAIAKGAPLYNDGDFDGCYSTYEVSAVAIEHDVGKSCKGPASALRTGREQASKRSTPAERAWAMRDAFDGILDVIDRRGAEL